jgi:hypothetical protein
MKQPLALTALLWSGFLAAALWSQTTGATVSGEVLDPSGAAVPDAALSAENIQTGVLSRARSNRSGVYLFPALQPGSYRLTAEREGFQQFVYNDLILDVGSPVVNSCRPPQPPSGPSSPPAACSSCRWSVETPTT